MRLLKIAVRLHSLHGIGQVSNGAAIPAHRTGTTLLLVLLRLHGVEFVRKCHDLIERLGCGNPVDERLFSIVDRNVHQTEQTKLEVQVDLIHDGQVIHVECLQLEQISIKDLLVPRVEVAAASGELLLDAAFNTGILNDIDARLVSVSVQLATLRCIHCGDQILRGSEQSMGNLMGDDHIAQDIAHLPVRNDEGAGSNVKGCGLGVGLERNKDVFGGECFGEKRGGGVHGVPMVWDRGEKVNPLSVPPVDFFSTGGTSCIKPWTG